MKSKLDLTIEEKTDLVLVNVAGREKSELSDEKHLFYDPATRSFLQLHEALRIPKAHRIDLLRSHSNKLDSQNLYLLP